MQRPSCDLEVDLSEVIRRSVDDTELEIVANLPELTGRSTPHTRPSLPPIPRRASVRPMPICVHSSPRMTVPKSPLQSPLGGVETNAFLEADPGIPGWWECAKHSGCFLLPTAVLLGFSVGLFVPQGEPCAWWYPILFTILALLGPFATWASTGLLIHYQRCRCPEATRAAGFDRKGASVRHTNSGINASNANSLAAPKAESARNPDDPLDFLRQDIAEWATSADGWIIIDTTGIILWCNAALALYFGYERDYLVQRNVRILMPQPYASEHDFFMRKQLKTGVCKILGKPEGRPVPVINRKGEQSMAMLSVDDHLDPHDISNYVFSGRLRFGLQDAALIKVKSKVAQGFDVVVACKAMDEEALARIVTDVRGTILYVNAAAGHLFGWSRADLVGREVKCLMGEHHASKHDEYLRTFVRRTQEADGTGRTVQSNIIGSGRDVQALTKDRHSIRIFLTVERIDQQSGDPTECFFHATIVPVTQVERSRAGSYCSSLRRSIMATAGKLPSASRPTLKSLQPRPCTVVAVAVHGLCRTERLQIQQSYDEALHVIVERAHAQRGVLQYIVGDCFVLVFNHIQQPNSSHRSSAACFLVELHQKWQYSILCRSLWLQTAAVCRSCYAAQLDGQQQLLSDAVDACFCALQAAAEARVKRPVIDGLLHQELMYSWTCRLVNVATLRHFKREPSTMEIYEVVERKKLTDDEEWMYQICCTEELDPWMHWATCWEKLRDPTPNYAEALGSLQSHLQVHPGDAPALWLQEVLRQEKHPSVMEMAGTLPFSLLCRCDDQHTLESLASSTITLGDASSG
eukprot:GGOE01048466.1.p1 GENE.GGOE01048466.1~~GGOE01048466.1.p1  ORF type:complete len:805 (-),score=237.64 GGOE01048466.1:417-2831(-)